MDLNLGGKLALIAGGSRRGGVIINVIGNAARTHDPDYICGSPATPASQRSPRRSAAAACATTSA